MSMSKWRLDSTFLIEMKSANKNKVTTTTKKGGDERNKVLISLKCTFLQVSSGKSLFGQQRAEVQLPAQKKSPLSL